jgi:hypothetical protein
MMHTNRRSALKLLGGAALTAGAVPAIITPASAQQELYVASKYQNFKRGTIESMNPESRTFTVVWTDMGRFKLKVSDLVVKTGGASDGNSYEQLKPGQIVDVQWYDYVDFLIAPMSAASMAQAAAMKAQGARIEGVPGSKPVMRLWEMDGMVTKVDPANSQFYIIYKSGGEPDRPAPNAGEVIQLPRVVSDAGKAAMAGLKPGDDVVTVWSQQTALNVKIIR